MRRNKHRYGILLVTVFILVTVIQTVNGYGAERRPLMRFPDIHENTVVFIHGEDIWSVPAEGGVASRLTIHDGQERFPKISPDGKLIAFTGEYDGNGDVYVMNPYGGNITRLTFHSGYDRVIGWHQTKNKIMFISGRKHFRFNKLYLINPDGSDLEEIILHNINNGSFSPDGNQIAFNKTSREFRNWKRYKGGTAQEIYLYDLKTNEEKNLSNFEGTDRFPMWFGEKIYFTSDRDRVLNIYSVDPSSGEIRQITTHTEYDVRFPSMGSGKIVYELGGTLWVLDLSDNRTRQIPVEIKADLPEIRPVRIELTDYIQGIELSPSGKRALIEARGEIFTVPRKNGPTRNLTKTSGVREKDAVWSPDGKRIAWLSDKSGEYEITISDPMGEKEAIQLTQHKYGYRHTLRWSPDSKKIAYTDHTLTLYILDVDSGKITKLDKAEYEHVDVSLDVKPIYDFQWSPNSRYITYSKMNRDQVYQVYIYDIQTKKIHSVSSGLFNDFHPVFSKDGKYLFFISNRRFDPTFCDFEWEMVYKKTSGIYCAILQENTPSILPYKSDEEGSEAPAEDESKEHDGTIDFKGISDRIEALPLDRGNYRYLSANEKKLFYLNKEEGDFNRFEFRPPGPMNLHAYYFKSRQDSIVIENINEYRLSADGTHIIYAQQSVVGIIRASETESTGHPLDLSNLEMWLDPQAEWNQIYNEVWRIHRDFYYEPNMHGLGWKAIGEKYARLLPFASCRQDLNYIIGELIGELNTSHTYIFGGDVRRNADRVNIGLLGVDWEIDKANQRYRFGRILRTPGWTRGILPPLAKPGINIDEGDYLLKVNGVDVTAEQSIYSYFLDMAGEQITLTVNKKASPDGARQVTVETTGSERDLRYLDWVESNRKLVEKESNGQIGYIHLPDTYAGSAREFPKYFYGQTRKKGLIIDGRFNGGGLDPDIFLRRLRKTPNSYWTRRQSHDQTSPFFAITSHMVCLTNRQAGSGGDELPHEFQYFGMGPVIGTRTWGGLVGVSNFPLLIDGGGMCSPDYRIYTPKGEWTVENEGVYPDIVVDLHPAEMAKGFDAQLMEGIKFLMQKIKEDPPEWPKHPPFPVDK